MNLFLENIYVKMVIVIRVEKKTNVPINVTSMGEVRNVFKLMKDSGTAPLISGDHVAFYHKALEIEKKSEALYREHAGASAWYLRTSKFLRIRHH